MAISARDRRQEQGFIDAKRQEETSPAVVSDRYEDYGDHNIVTKYDVVDSPHRSGPVGLVKDAALELCLSQWYGPKELVANVLIVLAFLVAAIVFVTAIDTLFTWALGFIS